MKKTLCFTLLLIGTLMIFAQPGSNQFSLGDEYLYNVIPLDSLNNQIPSEMYFRADLFSDIDQYNGKLADIFLTKEAETIDSLQNKPYLDSLIFHFDGTDGFEFFSTKSLEGFLQSLDSANIDPNFNFLNFFKSLEDWYSNYRFSAGLNNEYTLLSIDTTVAGYNIRFEYTGERFADEMIATIPYGEINCKKFLTSWKVSVFIFTWIELLSTKDTVWIDPSPEFWIVQEIIPTNHIDLTLLGIEAISIPGTFTGNVTLVNLDDETPMIPTVNDLQQNYPNPFNPSTTINFQLAEETDVSLKVYDALGNEVAVLVDEEKDSGVYSVKFHGSNLASGMYLYKLQAGDFVDVKKMIFMK